MKNTVAKKRTDPENVQAGINSGKKKRGQEPQRVKAAIGDSQRCKNTHALCRPSYHNSNHHGHKKQQQQQPQGSRKKRSESGGKNGSWKAGKKLTSGHTNARWCRKKTRKEKKKKERKKEKKTPPLERQASSSLSPLSSLLAFSLSPPRDRTKRAPKHHPAQSKLPMSAPTKTRPKKPPPPPASAHLATKWRGGVREREMKPQGRHTKATSMTVMVKAARQNKVIMQQTR